MKEYPEYHTERFGAEAVAWAGALLDRIVRKEEKVVDRSRGKIPYRAADGRFDDWSDRRWWWTNGFWGGILWELYDRERRSGRDDEGMKLFRTEAEALEEKLDADLMEYGWLDHDNGFKWLLTAVADYKLTGAEASRNRALLAAGQLAGRFNLNAGLFRAWNDEGDGSNAGIAIIDCMMNLPLLYWASKELKDPRFAALAMRHADTAMKAFVREDGSVNHIVVFDPETGRLLGTRGGQGLKEGSSWTRGQAWAIYGFAQSYRYTGRKEYLETAGRVADYFIGQIPESGHVPVDFWQPEDISWEDSTAAAIAACGLLELTALAGDGYEVYREAALRLLKTIERDRLNLEEGADELLEKCTAAYHDEEHDYPIIYGDYYYIEALRKLERAGE